MRFLILLHVSLIQAIPLSELYQLLPPVRENIQAGNAFYRELCRLVGDHFPEAELDNNDRYEMLWATLCPDTAHRMNELENALICLIDHIGTSSSNDILYFSEVDPRMRLTHKSIDILAQFPTRIIIDCATYLVDAYEKQDKQSPLNGPLERDLKDFIVYVKNRAQTPFMKTIEISYIDVSFSYQKILTGIRGYCMHKGYTRSLELIY